MNVSPVLSAQGTYPFVRIEQAKRGPPRRASRSSTSARVTRASRPIRSSAQALVDGLAASGWATRKAEGLPELREAIAGWCARRFGVDDRCGHAR